MNSEQLKYQIVDEFGGENNKVKLMQMLTRLQKSERREIKKLLEETIWKIKTV